MVLSSGVFLPRTTPRLSNSLFTDIAFVQDLFKTEKNDLTINILCSAVILDPPTFLFTHRLITAIPNIPTSVEKAWSAKDVKCSHKNACFTSLGCAFFGRTIYSSTLRSRPVYQDKAAETLLIN